MQAKIEAAKEAFGKLLTEQLARVEEMKKQGDFVDYKSLDQITIGVCGGDGIGPAITGQAQRIMEYLLKDEIASGKVLIKNIEGLTIERRVAENAAIPAEVLEELKTCDVILKGPTTTPQKGDPWPNVESANVAMRKALDLFANVRPVRIPEQGIDWTFYRENTEGAYAVGSKGVHVTEDLGVDFTVVTSQGCDRIIRAAFDYAAAQNRKRVTCVHKANILKKSEGLFLSVFEEIAKEYPQIASDSLIVDACCMNLVMHPERYDILVMPNLYGDIVSDLCSGLIGGLGVLPSCNRNDEIAMFEAVHGSAPDIAGKNLANPTALLMSACMMLDHLGYQSEADKVRHAVLDVLSHQELCTKDLGGQATCSQFAQSIIEHMK